MREYVTEEEQLENLRRWLGRYGRWVALGVLLVLLIVLGRLWWLDHQAAGLDRAAALFETLQHEANAQQQLQVAQQLAQDHPRTVYGQLGLLWQATAAAEQKDWALAEKHYARLLTRAGHWPELKMIACEKMLRAQMEQKQYQVALDKLHVEQKWMAEYPVIFYDLEGDLYDLLGRRDAALASYTRALDAIQVEPLLAKNMAQLSNWITLKRNDLQPAQALQIVQTAGEGQD